MSKLGKKLIAAARERGSEVFKVGDKVEKVKGYRWPGEVVASFVTLQGEYRVVVECTVPEVAGALHIYAPEQIAGRQPCGECHLRPGEVCDICRRNGRSN